MLPLVPSPELFLEAVVACPLLYLQVLSAGVKRRADICCLALWPNLTSSVSSLPMVLLLGAEGRGQDRGL